MSVGTSSISSRIPPLRRALSPQVLKLALISLFLAATTIWWSSRVQLSANFLPHWYCFVGNTRLLWTTVIADLLIGLSYVVISATLVWLVRRADRKSTRLNSSHLVISYAVFCLKKTTHQYNFSDPVT